MIELRLPDNLVAGFFVAWAYLRSETIVIPIALHALGNLVVVAGDHIQVAYRD